MKVGEAARLVLSGRLQLAVLWAIATDPERIQVALILGRPDELPRTARTPAAAYASLNAQQQRIVQQLGPASLTDHLPPAPPAANARTPESQAARRAQPRPRRRRQRSTPAPPAE